MPKGFQKAKAVGDMRGKGQGFHGYPKGPRFSIQAGETKTVRFIQSHDDIEWARKWKLPPAPGFQYGELVNCVDQYEDGTPDPGYAKGLKNGFKAYPLLIARQAPQFQKDAQGKYIRNDGKLVPTGTLADQVMFWECSYQVYEQLGTKDSKWKGLTSRDAEIRREGAKTDTKYYIEPADLDSGPQPLTDADHRLIQSAKIDLTPVLKIPSYEELSNYLNGGTTSEDQKDIAEQAADNSQGGDAGPNPFLT
jgi:hypothetical protein